MANIHMEYYTGNEHYTEGDVVEQDILNYVNNYSEAEYSDIFKEDSRWTVFYHLTDIRKAILTWYPFKKNESILEIGAGMGALTGLFCERCEKVVAVELTEIRAKTIYSRYADKDNLDIYVGNILNAEFEEKFDYISLIGVLEYQGNYNDTSNPYTDFLKKIQRFLKPNGKILIAIENKFGIKYWCGVPEDHTGVIYDGINNYPEGGKAKTFSKSELKTILEVAGIQHYKFFYPMPDYKLPQVILSEGYLPIKNMPPRIIPYYLYYPTLMASEKDIYDELLENKVFDFFANSFLVECALSDTPLCDVSMATVTADRKCTHQMCTVIHKDEYVEKFPLRIEGKRLLKTAYENIEKLKKRGVAVVEHNLIEADKDVIRMPYYNTYSLDKQLLEHAKKGERNEFFGLFNKFFEDILKSSNQVLSEQNCLKQNSDIDISLFNWGPILETGYIDMLPHNCFIVEEGERRYFDQEFSIKNLPAKFMVFRGIKNLYSFNHWLENVIPAQEVKSHFGLVEEIWNCFEKQDLLFLNELVDENVSRILCGFWYVDTSIFRKNAKKLMDFPAIQEKYNNELYSLNDTIKKLEDKKQELSYQLAITKDNANRLKEEACNSICEIKQNTYNKISSLNIDLKNSRILLKQKDEEIQELAYRIKGCLTSKELFGKAKDKEIEMLYLQMEASCKKNIASIDLGNRYKKLLHDIEDSTCWRMTAPLRNIKDSIRGGQDTRRNEIEAQDMNVELIPPPYIPSFVTVEKERPVPESGISARPLARQLANKLMQHDVISFDVFDTLLFRIFEKPTDVFKLVGLKLELMNFYKLRVAAELEAREKTLKKNGEINIYDIYQYLEQYIRIDSEKTLKMEFETEKECLYANPYMKEVFDLLKSERKTLIFVSDMYWPKKQIKEMLLLCGYDGFDDGFVSCDFQCNKGDGKLQQIVAQRYRNLKIFHIGDNFLSDIKGSQNAGWDTFYYKNCQELGMEYRPLEHESLVSSAYNGLVNKYIHNGLHVYSPSYEYGFMYGGLLVCGFCEWLNEFARQNQIEQIMFLARDCEIIEKVYNKHYKEIDNVYLRVSRLAMWQIVFEDNTEEFIHSFFKSRAIKNNEKIGSSLKKTGLECLLKYLYLYDLTEEDALNLETYEHVRKMIYDKKKEIISNFSNASIAAKSYFSEVIKNNRRICAVDLGWSGQILLFLRYFVKTYIHKDCYVTGAYIAATTDETANLSVGTQLLNSYVFSYSQNRDIRLRTDTVEGSMIAIFLEAMFSSTDPTLIRYDLDLENKVKFIFGHCTGNSEHIEQIHKGIMDFADLYNKKIGLNHKYFKISGSEAFAPFNQIATDFSYNYKIFKDYDELPDSFPQIAQQKCTTLGNILKEKKLL